MTLTLNYQNLLSTRVGEHGISPEDFDRSLTQRTEPHRPPQPDQRHGLGTLAPPPLRSHA